MVGFRYDLRVEPTKFTGCVKIAWNLNNDGKRKDLRTKSGLGK